MRFFKEKAKPHQIQYFHINIIVQCEKSIFKRKQSEKPFTKQIQKERLTIGLIAAVNLFQAS